ncbi:hypothetical protein DFH09DRAFT_1096679 [Mycena vulgaris]|nr:hypothetical protein DFH09DRAFT_1096679 [Mycena vulgaris]
MPTVGRNQVVIAVVREITYRTELFYFLLGAPRQLVECLLRKAGVAEDAAPDRVESDLRDERAEEFLVGSHRRYVQTIGGAQVFAYSEIWTAQRCARASERESVALLLSARYALPRAIFSNCGQLENCLLSLVALEIPCSLHLAHTCTLYRETFEVGCAAMSHSQIRSYVYAERSMRQSTQEAEHVDDEMPLIPAHTQRSTATNSTDTVDAPVESIENGGHGRRLASYVLYVYSADTNGGEGKGGVCERQRVLGKRSWPGDLGDGVLSDRGLSKLERYAKAGVMFPTLSGSSGARFSRLRTMQRERGKENVVISRFYKLMRNVLFFGEVLGRITKPAADH